MAAPPNNVELEAAKFLHKLIQESKDEPKKLATKLHVILQHMRSSGKENSMPYQVISRAMETVINEHGIDVDSLKSSRGPLTGGTHMGDSSSNQFAGSSQTAAIGDDSKSGIAENERANPQASSRPPVGPSAAGHDIYQGSVSHPGSKSVDQESPSSYDTKSANSQSHERHDPALDKSNQDDSKKASSKRKRADSSSTIEPPIENSQQVDSSYLNARKGKMANKVEPPRSLPARGGEHSQFNMVQGSGQMEHIPSLPNSMRSTNLASSMQQAANPKYREEIEVSSAHSALALQQGGSRLSPHDILNSRALWNQNRIGSSIENTQIPRFPSTAVSGNSMAEMFMHQSTASLGSGASVHGASPGASGSFPLVESGVSSPMQFGSASREAFGTESGIPGNNIEMNMLRGAAPRDTGKSPIFQATGVPNMPFKEQHLKQLRAQCLVFLAFRNRMMPKKLHLEIALGNFSPKEDGPSKELIDNKEKELSINDQSNVPEGTMLFGRQNDMRESEIVRQGTTYTGTVPEAILLKESKGPNIIREMAESQEFLPMGSRPDSSSVRTLAVSYDKDNLDEGQVGIINRASSFEGISKQIKPEMVPHESVPERKDISPSQSQIPADTNIQRNQNADSHLTSFTLSDDRKRISGMEAEHQTKMSVKDGNVLLKNMSEDANRISEIQRRSIPDGFKSVVVDDTWKNGSPTLLRTDQVEQRISLGTDVPPGPKYTTSEKWIMEQQKRKLVIEQNWALKQKKTDQRIAACSEKLKENVSSSEDISAKTKSVIELKKLQLLELQRRLRSEILNDFFKPISTDMERLKSVKKNRIGRRSKQVERYEQRQKEERQKRIRERQKEFFSEIELHKERVDDAFKMKRERWKGFNKYVREFHKRKERIHREKIDRIQREKINLLKINDVEGYLRMVQDAKSDRVKQLLKETEKYLQKLGSKLRDAKAVARQFETDVEENRAASFVENTEFDVENEDEADQAKHYLESNEKYYLMAHSIKESIMEQPTCLVGGKLREYQMNGLRWLLSLYNNHLNGILADEMGLGKTVQVISLICYLMETKNDRGPFLVVVPSSVLPGWETEINFWAPSINRIVYSGTPEERRRLFKERIVPQKFNVLLTTYEYLMNKHDRPKLSKLHWHYIIIDEGHRIKNASCKLNADLKHYQSSHRLLLTGTPLQNNLEELWALLNFLLPNIFNSSEDFSQWFNKPFESNGDNSADQALLSEEENLLIINRLHQVLRPFVLRRLKHKVENQLPEKIERLVRCEASSYQKLLMKRVEDNLGAIGTSKARSVHNSVMELRNICNHPYLSQLHVEEVHDFVPKHYMPNIVRLCGKLEMLDRLLPKLKATDHRVLFFSTMTRLLDVMEDYLCWKQYRYLRLDGHTSGGDRGALIDQFNKPGSPFFIFLLSIRAGGVGVNLQAADTVIIFDTDWNPQVDLQAQARAHRIGQKKDVLVLRLETVQSVEEQVRAAAEHKLGVANQSITAGFFDNNTSAEDRREYLESLLRECKKEEAAPVLDDDSLNDLIARSESEIEIFEAIDRQRLEEEMAMWKNLLLGQGKNGSEPIPPLPSRLLTEDELKPFYEAIKTYEASTARVASDAGANVGAKRKSGGLGGLDTQHYGRGKRAREVRSYEEQWTEEEFEKICQAESPESPKQKEAVIERNSPIVSSGSLLFAAKTEVPAVKTEAPAVKTEVPAPLPVVSPQAPAELPAVQLIKEVTPPSKRGRGRPRRVKAEISPPAAVLPALSGPVSIFPAAPVPNPLPNSATVQSVPGTIPEFGVWIAPSSESNPPLPSASPEVQSTSTPSSAPLQAKGQNRKTRRGKNNQASLPPVVQVFPAPSGTGNTETIFHREAVSSFPTTSCPDSGSSSSTAKNMSKEQGSVSHSVFPTSTETVGTKSGLEVLPVLHTIPVLIDSAQTVRTEVVSEVQPSSSNLMIPASAQTVRTEVVSEVQPVSTTPMVPVPVSFSTSSIVTGVAGTMPQFRVGIDPSSRPNAPSTYNAIGSQSINPSPAVPKQPKGRGRGRGCKPQSEVEAPLRRGRRRGPVAPVGEDPNSNEQPQSQPQESSGRKSIGTRRKAQEKGPLPTSGTSAILSDKTENQKIDLKTQEMKEPLPEEAVVSESEVAGSKSSEVQPVFDSAVASGPAIREFATKIGTGLSVNVNDSRDLVDKNSTLKTEVEGTLAVPLSVDPLVDMTRDKPPAPDDSVLQNAPSVLDLKLDKCDNQSGEGDVKEQQMSGSSSDNVVVSENVETKNLEEEKNSALLKLETNAPIVEPVTEEIQKEVDVEAQEINDPILQEAVASDSEVPEPETKIKASSFENEDNQRDPAEENSIVGTSVESTSAVPLDVYPMDVVPCERSLGLDTSVLETEVSVLSSTLNMFVYQSGKEDTKVQDMICPVRDVAAISEPGESKSLEDIQFSTLSRLEPEAPVIDGQIEKTEKDVDTEALENYDSTSQVAVVSKPEACEPKTKLEVVPPENLADSRDLVEAKSVAEDNVDGISAVTLNADPLDEMPCDEPATSVADITMGYDDQSGKDDFKDKDIRVPIEDNVVVAEEKKFVTWSRSEKTAPADAESGRIEKNFDVEAQESSDPILQEAVMSNPKASESDSNITVGSSENVADPVDLVEENLILETNVEGASDVPKRVENLDEGSDAILSDKTENQKIDLKTQEMKEPLPEEAVVSESEVAGSKISQEAVMSNPKASESDSNITVGSSENVADPVDLVEENLILETNVEGASDVPKRVENLDEGSDAILSDKTENQKIDLKTQEMKEPLPEEAVVSESEVAGSKSSEAQPVFDSAVASGPAIGEFATKIDTGLSVNGNDSRDLIDKNSTLKTEVEGTLAVPLNVDPLVDMTRDKPPAPDDSVLQNATSVLDLKLDKCDNQSGEEDVKEQQMSGCSSDNVVVSETGETKNLEEEKNSALLKLETNAPIVEPVTEEIQKEVDVEAQEINDPILQEAVASDSEAPEPETKIKASSFENEDNQRDPAEENSIVGTSVESTSAVPLDVHPMDVVPCERSLGLDTSVLETEVSVLSFTLNTFVCQSGKEDTKVQDMICPVRDVAVISEPGESKSLEDIQFSTLSRLEPEAPVIDGQIEKTEKDVDTEALENYDSTSQVAVVSKPEACEPKTKLEVVPPENLADSRDLVEEKSVAEDNVDDTSAVTLNADPLDEMPCDEPATSVADIPMGYDDQSGKDDVKDKDIRVPIEDNVVVAEEKKFVTWSTSEKAAPVDAESGRIEKNFDVEAQESSDPISQEAVMSNPKASESNSSITVVSSENVADPVDLVEENLILETNVEGASDVPKRVENLDDMPCEKPPAVDVSHLDKCEVCEERMDIVLNKRFVSEPVVSENQSLEEKTSNLQTNSPPVDPSHEKPETQLNVVPSETVRDSEQLCKDEPTGTDIEVDPVVSIHPILNDEEPRKEPVNPDVSLPISPLGSSSIQMDSALETGGAKESPSAEESKSLEHNN